MKKTNDVARHGFTRRGSLGLIAPALALVALSPALRGVVHAAPLGGEAELAELEARAGGRLGVTVLDTGTGARFGHRSDERFGMFSTFKLPLAAVILQRVDAGAERLDRAIAISKADVVRGSSVVEKHVGGSMTVGDLCAATVSTSDNAAANLLLATCGGPDAVTAFVRSLGDSVTRLDLSEDGMVAHDDERDTTSPAAMAATMQTILTGDVLMASSRDVLISWLKATTTGPKRLRAGLPTDWPIGHKTGTGPDGPANDIAIAWPPGRAPLIVTAYYEGAGKTEAERSAVLADVGRIAAASI